MQVLFLVGCNLSEYDIQDLIKGLPKSKLVQLDLSGNPGVTSINFISSFVNLQTLSLANCPNLNLEEVPGQHASLLRLDLQ